MSSRGMLKSMTGVGSWTFVSRILGFIREIIFAALFGSSATAEAIQIAIALPNMFRRFFAEGAFNPAFVPLYAKLIGDRDAAKAFAGDAFSALGTVLIIFSLLASLVMPALVWLMASGFVGDSRFDMATEFGRICFPYIIFISLAALVSGILNAHGRFATAAAAPVFLNIVLIACMWLGPKFGIPAEMAFIWGVPLSGIAQFALVWFAMRKLGYGFSLRLPKLTPELKRLAVIAAPAALAGGVVQINLLVGRQVASQFEGAIQWLAVADRLYQLPLGVVGIAIGVVLLPTLSKALGSKDKGAGKRAFNDAFVFALLLTGPATVALVCIPLPLVEAMFQRGAFNAADSVFTADALMIYGLGLPAFVLQKIYQPVFFARSDTKTPFRFAVIAMIVNVVLAVGLMPFVGYIASAIATTLSAYTMLILLIFAARKLGDATSFSSDAIRSSLLILFVCAVLALAFWPLSVVIKGWDLHPLWALLIYVTTGLIALAALCLHPLNRHLVRR
ncbi:MAG: murein biosynthesis integral membrane protein MurJ [Pseudomonadota bacterium]